MMDDDEQYSFDLALEVISRVLPLNTRADIVNMQNVLEKIINNICKEPLNQTKRTLKLQNKTLRSKLFDKQGAKEIMFILGFHKMKLSDETESMAMVLPLEIQNSNTSKSGQSISPESEMCDSLSTTWSWLDTQLKTCLEMNGTDICAECLIKIQLPNGFILKGAFFQNETLNDVVTYLNAKRPLEKHYNEYSGNEIDRIWVLSQNHPHIIFSDNGDQQYMNESLYNLKLTPRATLIAQITEPNLTQDEIRRRHELKIENALKKVKHIINNNSFQI